MSSSDPTPSHATPMDSNRVLVYHHRTQATDAQGIHIWEMCRAFGRAGWRVEMVALVRDEAVGQESRKGGLFQALSMLPGWAYECLEIAYNLVGVWRLWRAVHKIKPAFIYERYSIYNAAGALVSLLTGIPLVEEVNAPLALEKKRYGTIYLPAVAQRIETWIINHSHRTVAVTEALRRILIDNGAVPDRIVVMPNGVNLEEFARSGARRPADGGLTLGFVGWFRDWHGLRELIEVMGSHRWRDRGIHLLLVGDGPSRPEIEHTVARWGLQRHVTITGALGRERVREMLDRMDVALQPAATEYASPMKLIEYMAAGKAVVAPDQPNIRELLVHERNALLFLPRNWEDFVRQIVRLVESPELLRQLGDAARRTVLTRPLTWDHNARRVLSLLED